jgi:uncharacterized membrane protein YhhN
MRIPIIIYGVVISSLGSISLLNYIQEKSKVNLWLFLGIIIFIISDGLIAGHKFINPNEIYQICIMLAYIIAQYLI